MQLCHFHLPTRDDAYCAEFRAALDSSGVELHALLIDEGDITHPDHGERDAEWIASWLQTAEQLGAKHARVIAGKQTATAETLERSIERLKILVKSSPVRIEIENWFPLTDIPEAVLEILDRLEGHVGLCADWGNWPRPRKYTDLPKIVSRAETCHAKLEFLSPAQLDLEDSLLCLAMTKIVGFSGAYVLVNGGPGESEWDALEIQRKFLASGP
ncbi:Xylose isomerase domain protein TIM barrel [Fimbriimonas ginsengisoli Gsoil 348]|uniref:Xylose isomerase domain protein TIM barrel n=2 Tax=Fimbriimonas ginsengisoli TaxID=1005039 RepID=A0A068NNT6_FIMGI|nr:Xylose isomerase domain protein TIM barrel [Fimbriimonas ginsengisoli Gsoil 348]